MSEPTNVARLADFQKRRGHVEPEVCRDANEILSDLGSLAEPVDLEKVHSLTQELVAGLKGVNPLFAEMQREAFLRTIGNKIHAPARFFDAARQAAQSLQQAEQANATGGQGRGLSFEDPDPWPEPVNGAVLLHNLKKTFERYIVLAEGASVVLALWVIHTFAINASWVSPRLAITSPEKRCGKTRTLTLLSSLVAKPLQIANVTPAAVFRCVESFQNTILIDEADTFLDGREELRGILNSGHQKDGHVMRVVGDEHEPRVFATFAPVAIAKIDRLPETLADRSIEIAMRRKRSDERVERLRIDRLGELEPLRQQAARWVVDNLDRLRRADPEEPAGLNDRAADNWRPLFAIADAAGGNWPGLARHAAELAIDTGASEPDASLKTLLLTDLHDLFHEKSVSPLYSKDIVAALLALEDRPWAELRHGRPLTTNYLARLLRPYGIAPRQVRIGETTSKGYVLSELEDVFARYLPASNRNTRNNALESTTYADFQTETEGTDVSVDESSQISDSTCLTEDVSVVSVGERVSGGVSLSAHSRETTDL